jgi:site-specific recombinase XerD
MKVNLTDAIERYPAHLGGRGISVETQSKYLYELKSLSRLMGADDEWPTYPQLADWQAGLTKLSNVTIHHKVTTVKSFFRWAVEMEYIPVDPAAKLVVPKRPKKLPQTLSDSQIDYLLHKWVPYYLKRDEFLVARDKALVKVLVMTGLRRAELASLNVGDVSLEGRAIAVRSGKGDRDRTVIIPKNVVPELKVLTDGREYDEPLFVGKGGNRLKPNAINEMFTRKVSKQLGRRVTPHQCRHAFATYLVNRGTPLHQVQAQLGHTSLATTQIYLHATRREMLASMDVLDDLA